MVDASGMIAAVDRGSRLHPAITDLLDELCERRSTRLAVSPFVLAEVDYLLSVTKKRPDIALRILRDVARGRYRLERFEPEDLDRAADVIERYADQNIGLADASNVVLAERHDTLDILTTDERHFRVLRGPGDRPFRLLPVDC